MRNRDNDIFGIYANFLKVLGVAFLLFLLKYVAIALIAIGLIVALFYWIKEYFTE
jgi:hypothetical protein